jgi:hypothetical protein
MATLLVALLGLFGAVLWLGLLLATGFSLLAVGVGLLAMVFLLGNTGTNLP